MSSENYKYGRYVPSNQESRWATIEEIQNSGTYVNLSDNEYPVGGLPLLSDGREAYVDGEDTHTLIFGATGSKKTRLFCMPMVNMFAKAGESFVVTDPKGEIYAKTSGLVKANGYKTVVLNFRDIGYGDMWNPLAYPYELYHSNNRENGVAMINDFISTIAAPMFENTKDVFWPQMASSFALACLMVLMESADKSEVNLASLGRLCSFDCEKDLKELSSKMDPQAIASINLNSVLSAAEATRRSIYVSLYGMVGIFNTQKNLTRMLSGNSIDIKNIGREKTAVYLIIPDEKTTCHFLVTTFIKQAYEILISEAQKEKDFKLPVRVNFVLDEFCNMPKVPDMPAMISAARSRNMRYFLIAQSLHQLKGKYGEDADTIKGNCDNWVFLTSKELSLLNEISDLCGSIYTADKRQRKLISVSELQRLDKKKGEALIMHSRQYPIITEIADIDMYDDFKGFSTVPLREFSLPNAPMFSIDKLLEDIEAKRKAVPFSKVQSIEDVDFEEDENYDMLADEIIDDVFAELIKNKNKK